VKDLLYPSGRHSLSAKNRSNPDDQPDSRKSQRNSANKDEENRNSVLSNTTNALSIEPEQSLYEILS